MRKDLGTKPPKILFLLLFFINFNGKNPIGTVATSPTSWDYFKLMIFSLPLCVMQVSLRKRIFSYHAENPWKISFLLLLHQFQWEKSHWHCSNIADIMELFQINDIFITPPHDAGFIAQKDHTENPWKISVLLLSFSNFNGKSLIGTTETSPMSWDYFKWMIFSSPLCVVEVSLCKINVVITQWNLQCAEGWWQYQQFEIILWCGRCCCGADNMFLIEIDEEESEKRYFSGIFCVITEVPFTQWNLHHAEGWWEYHQLKKIPWCGWYCCSANETFSIELAEGEKEKRYFSGICCMITNDHFVQWNLHHVEG
jgi:hypothetical protein